MQWSHLFALIGIAAAPAAATEEALHSALDQSVQDVEERVVAWRRDIHQHPELSNRETRTGELCTGGTFRLQ